MKIGISSKVLNLLKQMYKNITCRVKSNGLLSQEFLYSIGVRQGCVLSPLLFNLFINDVVELLQSEKIGISAGEAIIFILLYADDIVLLAENENDLQYMVNKLRIFCEESKMYVNTSKTQWLIFEKKESSMNFQLSFCDNHIEKVKIFKYLGIFFDHKLTFADHVKFILIKADKAAYLFWKFINRFQSLNVILNATLVTSHNKGVHQWVDP